ncbi:MAG: group III truncated hemoglobin [Bacteroidia bacterium]|nr:group III truncated hemoglobin [Bacteroidia bacterium]NNL32555.1 group III truncated hemoglobin [Flavobacteriaceae bacterium]RZW56528.1 MAG: group III truncated hemoglobin [Flavobacteriaceae bacterium]
MEKKDITSREDIHFLVSTFYNKVRSDELLAPFFSGIEDWDEHLERLTTFWESSLFLKTKYYGDPLKAHVKVDQEHGNTMGQEHFGQWMNLWYETVDQLFEGERAQMAKNRARKMSTFLYLKIFEARS